MGHVHLLLGNLDDALRVLEEAVAPLKIDLSAVPSIYPLTGLAEAYRLKGDIDRALQTSEEALSILRKKGEHGFGAWAIYYMAKIQSEDKAEQIQQAIQSYRQAIQQSVGLGMRPLEAHCHMGLGQAYLKRGLSEEARSELVAAIELYRSMDMGFWLPEAESALARITDSAQS